MVLLSEKAMCMSEYDRRNQLACWYTDGINLCTKNCYMAEKIKAECKRRNLKYGYIRARDTMIPYNIYKIHIGKSLKVFNKKL